MSPIVTISRRSRTVADQSGFTLIEALMAMVIFVGVVVALAGLLTSAVSATKVARERTVAEQAATEQIESIRNMPYDSVGVVSGNPPGTIAATKTIDERGLKATLTTQVAYVADPTPTSYATAANYKRVTVVVTRNGDPKELARQVTYVAPPAQAPYGGINKAIVNVGVSDYALNTPVENANVSLLTGPSAPRNGTTDDIGKLTFASLDPNPTSGPQAYYDVDVALPGYKLFTNPAAQHFQVAPGQTFNSTLQIYKPATINVALEAGGSPFTGPATVKVTSELTGSTHTFPMTGGALTITSLGGADVIPAVNYTIEGSTNVGPLCADSVAQYVPDNYPTDMSTTFTLDLVACPSGNLTVSVTQLGLPAGSATVTVSGGPYDQSYTAVTDASGVATFADVPEGAGYTVTATKAGESASTTTDVTVAGPNAVSLTLPDPPMGTVVVTVTQLGLPAGAATVTLNGGPYSVSATGTTNASGQVTFSNVPTGSGYTMTATKLSQTNSTTASVSTGTNNVPITLPNPPTGSILVTVTGAGSAVSGASVTVSGGSYGISVTGTTNASGQVTFTNVPAGSGYSVAASRNGSSASATASVTAGSTTNVAIAMPTGAIAVTVAWQGQPAGSASVSVTGGPFGGTYTGTTNSSGQVTITVPATTSSFPYTITASKNTGTGSATVTTVNQGATVAASVTLTPVKTLTITVQRGGSTASGADLAVNVSVSGGPNGAVGSAPAYTTSGTTNGSSQISIVLPAATGYTYRVRVYLATCGSFSSNRSGANTSVSAATTTTTATVNMSSSTCPPSLP